MPTTSCNPLPVPHHEPFFPAQVTRWNAKNAAVAAIQQTPCPNPAGSGVTRYAQWYKPAQPIVQATCYLPDSSPARLTPAPAVYIVTSVNRCPAAVPG